LVDFLGIVTMYVFLCLGEVTLRTKEEHQLPGFTKKYLGKKAEIVMIFAMVFGIYSALLAYLIGESQSLSFIFTGDYSNSIYFAIGFWLVMTLLLREGLRSLQKVETWGVLAILAIVFILAILYLPNVEYENVVPVNFAKLFLPFGVVLFSLMGFTSIPELELEIKGDEKKMKKAIIWGVSIPIVVYFVFSFIFVGVLGSSVPQVATLGLGKLVTLLGIFTMLKLFCFKFFFKRCF